MMEVHPLLLEEFAGLPRVSRPSTTLKLLKIRVRVLLSASLSPLASQVTYYVRAYATNAFGTAYGNEVSFTSSSADAVTDIDGNVYPYIQIGTQTWMTTNLKTTHYTNGDPITDGSVNSWYKADWSLNQTIGAYSYPEVKHPTIRPMENITII